MSGFLEPASTFYLDKLYSYFLNLCSMIQKKTNFSFKLDCNTPPHSKLWLLQQTQSVFWSLLALLEKSKKLWTLQIIMTNLFSNPCPHPVSLLMCHNWEDDRKWVKGPVWNTAFISESNNRHILTPSLTHLYDPHCPLSVISTIAGYMSPYFYRCLA